MINNEPYGTAVDIFSLGCIMFALLTKRMLFIDSIDTDDELYFNRLVNNSTEE